jgi:hypothetical protein
MRHWGVLLLKKNRSVKADPSALDTGIDYFTNPCSGASQAIVGPVTKRTPTTTRRRSRFQNYDRESETYASIGKCICLRFVFLDVAHSKPD